MFRVTLSAEVCLPNSHGLQHFDSYQSNSKVETVHGELEHLPIFLGLSLAGSEDKGEAPGRVHRGTSWDSASFWVANTGTVTFLPEISQQFLFEKIGRSPFLRPILKVKWNVCSLTYFFFFCLKERRKLRALNLSKKKSLPLNKYWTQIINVKTNMLNPTNASTVAVHGERRIV